MSRENTKDNVFVRILKYLFPYKGDKPAEVIRKIVFLVAAVVLVVSVSKILIDYAERAHTNKLNQELSEQFHNAENAANKEHIINVNNTPGEASAEEEKPREILPQFKSFLEQNPDTIGWLTLPGPDLNGKETWVDNVVMQCDDNDKYLTHNFNMEVIKSGELFVDYESKITPTREPGNIVIYGHNMASGLYFGQLPAYFNWGRTSSAYGKTTDDPNDISWYQSHPTLEFSTLYKKSTYKIFACMLINTEPEADAGNVFDYYLVHDFNSKYEFNAFVAEVLDRSTFYNPDVNVKYGDQLITLSTCMWNYGDTELRFVVFARETREGESPTVDVSKAYANPNPKFYQLYYDLYGYEWKGRNWDTNLLVGYEGEVWDQ